MSQLSIKQIRSISGLSQVKFDQKYGIPRRTIESWECDKNNPNYRLCPNYIHRLLERVVKEDYSHSQQPTPMRNILWMGYPA